MLKVEFQLRQRASPGLQLQWKWKSSTKSKLGLAKLSPLKNIYCLEGLGSHGL